ncbi:MAG: hypothetical protein E7214_07870 [Clostridium sp.]|nr:hypothetical protein [Clostridium sp.]
MSALKFDTFNSISNIVTTYPDKSIDYEFKFINPTLDINGKLPEDDYVNLKYSYTSSKNNTFQERYSKTTIIVRVKDLVSRNQEYYIDRI